MPVAKKPIDRRKTSQGIPRPERWRQKISAGVLAERLMRHATSDLKPEVQLVESKDGKFSTYIVVRKDDMKPTQVEAAKILFNKIAPDLQRVTQVGDPDEPVHSRTELSLTPEQEKAIIDAINARI